eukprot:Nk52_evm1s2585 gene=Nk52_evmTU1s2585
MDVDVGASGSADFDAVQPSLRDEVKTLKAVRGSLEGLKLMLSAMKEDMKSLSGNYDALTKTNNAWQLFFDREGDKTTKNP